MGPGMSSASAKQRCVRPSLRLLLLPAVLGALLSALLVVLLPASAQAATRWGPVRSSDRGALAGGTWASGTRLLNLTLTDATRGPKCAWVLVKAGGYAGPLHVCRGSQAVRFRVTQPGPVSISVCSGTRRAPAAATCRTKVLH